MNVRESKIRSLIQTSFLNRVLNVFNNCVKQDQQMNISAILSHTTKSGCYTPLLFCVFGIDACFGHTFKICINGLKLVSFSKIKYHQQ